MVIRTIPGNLFPEEGAENRAWNWPLTGVRGHIQSVKSPFMTHAEVHQCVRAWVALNPQGSVPRVVRSSNGGNERHEESGAGSQVPHGLRRPVTRSLY